MFFTLMAFPVKTRKNVTCAIISPMYRESLLTRRTALLEATPQPTARASVSLSKLSVQVSTLFVPDDKK
jgi:hypothetical protein